jgi:chemotaxis response regulator CheB
LCHYLSRLLESHGFDVVSAGPLNEQFLGSLQLNPHDVLLIDFNEDTEFASEQLEAMLVNWREPVLTNDSMATEISLQHGDPEFGNQLAERINRLLARQH